MRTLDLPLATMPRIALAGRFPLADRGFATNYRGRVHALHIHGYAGRMRLAGETIAIAADDVTISPAGLVSSYDLDAPGKHWCIHISADDGAGATMPVDLHLRTGAAAAATRERFAHAVGLHRAATDPIAGAAAAVAVQELLLWLARLSRPQAAAGGSADRAAAFIDEHFDQPIDMADIAAAIGRSPAALARAFRCRFGTTMPHRLLERRVGHARYLLESTDLPIWRVAERVGIPDAQHFNKTVRRLLGNSPSAIRAAAGAAPKVDPDR